MADASVRAQAQLVKSEHAQSIVMVQSTEDMPGPYEVLGIVHGCTVRAKPITKDLWQNVRNIIGGEMRHYSVLVEEAVDQAMDRLTQNAARMGANGVIGIRMTSINVAVGGAEVVVYGTAVRFLDGVEPAPEALSMMSIDPARDLD